jgi:hypothetical protein
VGAAGVLIQTTSLMYTVPMALAACVSTRVKPPSHFPARHCHRLSEKNSYFSD